MSKGGFIEIDTEDLDDAVASSIGDGTGKVKKTKPGQGKGKAGHAGTKGQDKRGVSKKTLYLDLDTQALLEHLARAENIPQADIIAAGLHLLDQALKRGLDLSPFKTIVYSDSQAWRGVTRLERLDEIDFFSGNTQH